MCDETIINNSPGIFVYGCAAPHCNNKYFHPITEPKYTNKKFFQFPEQDIERRVYWFQIMNIDFNDKRTYLCEEHFVEKYFTDSDKTTLTKFAIPTLPTGPVVKYPRQYPYFRSKYSCVIPKCKSKYYRLYGPHSVIDYKNIKFIRMPSKVETHKKWIEIIRRATGVELPMKTSMRICVNHFKKKFITASGNLTYNGYPSLFSLELDEYNQVEAGKGNFQSVNQTQTDVKKIINVTTDCSSRNVTKWNFMSEHNYSFSEPAMKLCPVSNPVICRGKNPESLDECNSVSSLTSILDAKDDKFLKYRKYKTNKFQQKAMLLKRKLKIKLLQKKFGTINFGFGWPVLKNQKDKLNILDKKHIFYLAKSKKAQCSFKIFENFVVLPFQLTLKSLLHKVSLHSGPNLMVFNRLSKIAKKLKRPNKFCVLMFGTMPLTSKLEYCNESDKIFGYPDFREPEAATHVLVFMIQGLNRPWKQPIAYYFIRNLEAKLLLNLLTDVISMLQDAGLHVVGALCKHTLENKVNLLNLLRQNNLANSNNPYLVVNNQKICLTYDPSSLLVSTRNALFKYIIEYESAKFANFNDIVNVYNADKTRTFRKLAKLRYKDLFLDRNNSLKHNVGVAAKTLSYSVASSIEVDLGVQGKNTARFIYEIDLLFDSFNKEYKNNKSKDGLKRIDYRCRLLLWRKMKKFINQWIFHNKTNGMTKRTLPFKKAWIRTIEGTEMLWRNCRKKGFNFFKTKLLNLDSLQNFFDSVCYFGANTRWPTAYEFVAAFKLSLLNNMILPFNAKSNCKRDNGLLLDNYRDLFKPSRNNVLSRNSNEINDLTVSETELNFCGIHHKYEMLAKICNYLLGKLKLNCNLCKSSIVIDNLHLYCFDGNDKQIPLLFTADFNQFILSVHQIVIHVLNRFGRIDNIRSKLKSYLVKNINFGWFKCNKHKSELSSRLLNLSILKIININLNS